LQALAIAVFKKIRLLWLAHIISVFYIVISRKIRDGRGGAEKSKPLYIFTPCRESCRANNAHECRSQNQQCDYFKFGITTVSCISTTAATYDTANLIVVDEEDVN
jgi:hypothetical protein